MLLSAPRMMNDTHYTACTPPVVCFLTLLLIVTLMTGECFSSEVEYSVSNRSDGGYSLTIVYQKRYWKPITAEGFFPKKERHYTIDIVGKGEEWSYRNQKGRYYSADKIKCNKTAWDFGYAWIDAEGIYLYLNMFWVTAPDSMTPSDVNGRYRLTGAPGK